MIQIKPAKPLESFGGVSQVRLLGASLRGRLAQVRKINPDGSAVVKLTGCTPTELRQCGANNAGGLTVKPSQCILAARIGGTQFVR